MWNKVAKVWMEQLNRTLPPVNGASYHLMVSSRNKTIEVVAIYDVEDSEQRDWASCVEAEIPLIWDKQALVQLEKIKFLSGLTR